MMIQNSPFQDEFHKLTEEIRSLKRMIEENKKTVHNLHQKNSQLRGVIEQLKQKRHDLIFGIEHVKNLRGTT